MLASKIKMNSSVKVFTDLQILEKGRSNADWFLYRNFFSRSKSILD